jgi:hypothetical protein
LGSPVPIYRALMLEVERRRQALGFPMEKFSEWAGLCDRFYPKALHADKPSGRQVQWGTFQIIIDALFPNGVDVILKPRPGAVMSENDLKAKLLQLKAIKDPKSQRELMSELGKRGAESRRAKLSKARRSAIARRAIKTRWRRERKTRTTPKQLAPDSGNTQRA